MTDTPITPIPSIIKYGVKWRVSNGGPINDAGEGLGRTEAEDSGDGFPVLVSTTDGMQQQEISYFHTKYRWDSVNLSYSALDDTGFKPLKGFSVSGTVFEYEESQKESTPANPNNPGGEEEEEEQVNITTREVEYTLTGLSIVSSDPNSGGTWVFPDDYPDIIVDRNHPTQYGGVILFTEYKNPDDKKVGEYSKCGIEDGPNSDGVVPWTSSLGSPEEAFSGYNYIDVFDGADFSYTPRNSTEDIQMTADERFRLSPYYPDVKDPFDLSAPIYPMNMVNSFVPDDRESVDVIYQVTMTAKQVVGNTEIDIPLENGTITIKQTCVQDTSNYSEQLEALLSYCNWNNPQDLPTEELSPYYPYLYPYTMVNGFEGLGLNDTPKTRMEDKEFSNLERGDVWFNPTTNERKYWSVSDVPETIDVVEEGKRYRTKDNVPCVWEPNDNCNPLKGRTNVPFGLLVNITCENGKVKSVEMSDESLPQYFQDGDEVVVSGGDGQARLKINIDEPERWVNNYISHI